MIILLAYFGGILTIVSPCILPVLPFVFARAGQSFTRSALPMLAGMALTFALVAMLVTVGGSWAVHANQYGRYVALAILALFGLTLLLPRFADRVMHPLVSAGARISATAEQGDAAPSVFSSVLLGIGTGLLWAPCAGPILGLVLTGAALHGADVGTFALLLAYALGSATSLALALLVGGRLFAAMKRSLGAGEWVRRGLGAALLVAVVAIALGADTGWLARVSTASTNRIEQSLVASIRGETEKKNESIESTMAPKAVATANESAMLPIEGTMPPLDGAVEWLNSPPLTAAQLRGKVVVIDFWTYSCVNCLRTLPYVRAWYGKYKDQGLVVIGVHAPEFAFEKDIDNVKRAVKDLHVDYPVAIDNDYAIWRAFDNQYWPAHYFIDAQGRIRHHHFGEGEYAESEDVIKQLLAEAGAQHVASGIVKPDAGGVALAAESAMQSPETYLGYDRAENFASTAVRDREHEYSVPATLTTNQWGLGGTWNVADENAKLARAGGRIAFRFHARDVNLVLGPSVDGKPVRYKVSIDGKPPGASHGVDTTADGSGEVTSQRLYQLLRVDGDVADRTFEIEFLDPGVEAFAFTFG
ncbi:MAG TPA: cytochrome c biogenesis protein DipZ [Rhodanobacteraceae bacterium]|nr:cytochrome c biogenesis protein DipZ [Rhodanobacteraceae bacterium]